MARATVLVVDDEPNILRTVRTALRAEGYEVETAEDGAAALERLGTRSYDVVLLDVQLPKIGGLEVLQRRAPRGSTRRW
jgi:CheY-like chemotaxis protein